MDNVTYNGLCVKLWRVPFVVLIFTAFVFVSGAWGACSSVGSLNGLQGTSYCSSNTITRDYLQCSSSLNYRSTSSCTQLGCTSNLSVVFRGSSSGWLHCAVSGGFAGCSGFQSLAEFNIVGCSTQCEADSVVCSQNPEATWNSDNCTCDTLTPPDTTYRCQNTTIGSSTDGVRPIAVIYRCISTGSSSDQCIQTNTLNGTCQDWGFCPDGVADCDVSPDSTGRPPCSRSGGSTTSSRNCYYQCPDGSSMACAPTSTEYVAGNIYVGSCPERPPASCYPGSSSGDSSFVSSSSVSPGSSSGFAPDTLDPGTNIDYTQILVAIHDTLHHANKQRDILKKWDLSLVPSVENIDDWTLNTWRETESIDNKLQTYQSEGFNLASDVKSDIDSARSLLYEIERFLEDDSLKVYSSDTSLNPLVRDIRDVLLDSSLSRSDSLKNEALAGAFRPYLADSGLFYADGVGGRMLGAVLDNFGRDSALSSLCERYYQCLRSGGGPGACSSIDPEGSCTSGGTPIDGITNISMSILETLWDGLFGDDSTPSPGVAPVDSSVDLGPGYSSAVADMSEAIDSALSPNLKNIIDDIKRKADSLKNARPDSVKVSPDSLWRDSSELAQYVDHILLPSGTGTDCFICQANLGTLNGLSDTTLAIYIDFSNFGGYNWCEIIRAVVKIATLVTCISLTLGSWAAAFGYNPKNDS